MEKTHNIKMLPTDTETNLGIRKNYDTPKTPVGHLASLMFNLGIADTDWEYQYLYALSDESIENENWFYNISTNKIHKAGKYADIVFNTKYDQSHIKKIIASSNPKLGLPLIHENLVDSYVRNPTDTITFIYENNKLKTLDNFALWKI